MYLARAREGSNLGEHMYQIVALDMEQGAAAITVGALEASHLVVVVVEVVLILMPTMV